MTSTGIYDSPETVNRNRQVDSDRFNSALWYAWGRADASPDGPYIDPFVFAAHYVAAYADFRDNRRTFMASIQDTFAAWRAAS